MDSIELTPAEKLYKKHLEHMKRYQQKNKEKIAQYMKNRYHRIKEEQPDKHREMLAKKKEKRITEQLKIFTSIVD